MKRNWMLVFVAALAPHLVAQGRPVTPADQAAGQAWWAHIKALADNGMEGRLTGSEGYLRAAKYVVSQFDAMGLQPAGVNGYYQPVKFDVTRRDRRQVLDGPARRRPPGAPGAGA